MTEITEDKIREIAREEIEKAGQVDIPQIAKNLFELKNKRLKLEKKG